jgi:formate dehydrogenase maturation protein FdhE
MNPRPAYIRSNSARKCPRCGSTDIRASINLDDKNTYHLKCCVCDYKWTEQRPKGSV